MYMSAIKTLLGVRKTTANNTCLIECGYPSLKGKIKNIQQKSIRNLIQERSQIPDDPFHMVWTLVNNARTPAAKYINDLLGKDNILKEDLEYLSRSIRNQHSTKSETYTQINNCLKIHDAYTTQSNDIPDFKRLAFTRLRTSAHSLAIETGRWSRIPRENRLCVCGIVQTESHICIECPLSANLRSKFPNLNFTDMNELFTGCTRDVVEFTYNCLKLYET